MALKAWATYTLEEWAGFTTIQSARFLLDPYADARVEALDSYRPSVTQATYSGADATDTFGTGRTTGAYSGAEATGAYRAGAERSGSA